MEEADSDNELLGLGFLLFFLEKVSLLLFQFGVYTRLKTCILIALPEVASFPASLSLDLASIFKIGS